MVTTWTTTATAARQTTQGSCSTYVKSAAVTYTTTTGATKNTVFAACAPYTPSLRVNYTLTATEGSGQLEAGYGSVALVAPINILTATAGAGQLQAGICTESLVGTQWVFNAAGFSAAIQAGCPQYVGAVILVSQATAIPALIKGGCSQYMILSPVWKLFIQQLSATSTRSGSLNADLPEPLPLEAVMDNSFDINAVRKLRRKGE